MGDKASIESETPDERTIRLLNEEVTLLRKRAGYSDRTIRRVEAVADAAAARFAEKSDLLGKEIALLRKRVASSRERERGFKVTAKAAKARSAHRGHLLHEVNHRAKNSIQMAMSLLNLQRQMSEDPQVRLPLANAVERLSHIARVHSMLYIHSPDEQVIDLAEYLKIFCSELHEVLAGDVELVYHGSKPTQLDAALAINLALITSEAVTNALKHAFPEGGKGTIHVECGRDDGRGMLVVRDNGTGMKDSMHEDTMGIRLIRTLVEGIDGKLRIEACEGTRVQVTFPL